MINNYTDKAIEAFTFCRNAGNLIFNGKVYQFQLPNLYELQQIYNNRTDLEALDPTAGANTDKTLSNWSFGSINNYVWSSNENDIESAWGLDEYGDGIYDYKSASEGGVCPIVEIELS